MARNRNRSLIITGLALAMALLVIQSHYKFTFAQNGICPDDMIPVQTPNGTYPGGSAMCYQGEGQSNVVYDQDTDLPCDAALATYYDRASQLGNDVVLGLVPPNDYPFPSGKAVVQWEATFWEGTQFFNQPGEQFTGNILWQLTSYNPLRQQIDVEYVNSFDHISVWQTDGTCHPDDLICIQEPSLWRVIQGVEIDAVQGGYFELYRSIPLPYHVPYAFYASLQMYDSWLGGPALCEIEGPIPTITPIPAPPTNTPTPGATPTATDTPEFSPTPTDTATNTPTLNPTQPGPTTTWTPRPTNTRETFYTRPAENTPTPFLLSTIPPLSPPSVSFPSVGGIPTPIPLVIETFEAVEMPDIEFSTVGPFGTPEPFDDLGTGTPGTPGTPDGTAGVIYGDSSGFAATAAIMVTAWHTQTTGAINRLSITQTMGISSPTDIVDFLTSDIVGPISLLKSIQLYMENLWPLILFVLLAFIWIMFTLIVKASIAVVTDVVIPIVQFVMRIIPFV